MAGEKLNAEAQRTTGDRSRSKDKARPFPLSMLAVLLSLAFLSASGLCISLHPRHPAEVDLNGYDVHMCQESWIQLADWT